MPTVAVDALYLHEQLRRPKMTEVELDELCFDFGIELEDVATDDTTGRMVYKIDVPANRYDLLCSEGVARALVTFTGLAKPPDFALALDTPHEKIIVKAETAPIRPHVVGAILRNVSFDELNYQSFIDLQDKLHNNICRKRTLVAIGTHDYDTIKGPFTYEALSPEKIKFVPLNQTAAMDGNELMTFYESDRKLSKFLHIIRDSPVFPVIYDSTRTVCSLPPIINGDHSKIKLSTKNVFIECTATDLTKAKIVLNTVVTIFSQYCAKPFTVEPVQVIYPTGPSTVYPDLSPRFLETDRDYICNAVGVQLDTPEVCRLLEKMSLAATAGEKPNSIKVKIPPSRSDILQECDVMEDVAISYGFNKIPKTMPATNTIAAPFKLNKLSDQVRQEIALAGYSEVLPLILCSSDENAAFLQIPANDDLAVKLANPKTVEYQVVRTTLLPGVLKTLSWNKKMPLPIKVFEVSDVVFKDDTLERRARNERHVCIAYSGKTSGFELIHGVVDRIMKMLNVPFTKDGFCIRESDCATFFPGRRADIMYQGQAIGTFGTLHPEVLEKFEIPYPASAVELNLEPFL